MKKYCIIICLLFNYSSIAGGCNIAAQFATIGGSGNTDSGYNYAGIFGTEVKRFVKE